MSTEAYPKETEFLKVLKEDCNKDKVLIGKVTALATNDWEGLKAIAAEQSFEVTIEGLKKVLPETFFAKTGWDKPLNLG